MGFETAEGLICDRIPGFPSIPSLIAELENTYDMIIPMAEIVFANLNSAKAVWAMIRRLQVDV